MTTPVACQSWRPVRPLHLAQLCDALADELAEPGTGGAGSTLALGRRLLGACLCDALAGAMPGATAPAFASARPDQLLLAIPVGHGG